MKRILMAALMLLPLTAWAGDLKLDNDQSAVTFVSVKKGSVGEVHHFSRLSGEADGSHATVDIDLASVETGVAIRNERMRGMLFDVSRFATAKIRADTSTLNVKQLKAGEQLAATVSVNVGLHGISKQLEASVTVVRLANGGLMVSSRAPVIVNAADFGLEGGIEALRDAAKLPSIATAVPVSFVLVFTR